jgi:hypothetical protein
MKQDCQILKSASIYVRKWIDKQPNVKEESITDWLLYDISDKTNRIIYKDFTRNEEAKITGADWEWWFLYPNISYKLRVQAKKVKTSGDNYSSIAYANKHGLQIDKLIEDATKKNFLPMYAFYTSKVDKVKCQANILDEGVYLTGANGINNKFIKVGKQVVEYNDILEETVPLSCILCCDLIRSNNGNGFSKFLSTYFNTELGDDSFKEGESLGKYESIPSYVSSLIKSQNENLPDWWEQEFGHMIEDVNGILIFDNREQID